MGKLSDEQMVGLAAKGIKLFEIAKRDGTSKQNISQRLRRLKKSALLHVARDEERGKAVVQHNIDAASQLGRINFEVNKLLDQATSEDREIKRLVALAESVLEKGDDQEKAGQLLQQIVSEFHKDQDTIFRASGEIREQIKLQLDIFKVWYSHQAIQEFQRVVLDAVGSVDSEFRDRIIAELRSRRVIR